MSALAFTRQTFARIDDQACLPCQQHAQEQQDASQTRRFAEEGDLPPVGENSIGWSGTITLEGVATGDGRMIERGALRWATLPIPLRWVEQDSGGHVNAVVVGLINTIERGPKGRINSTGTIDLDTEEGRKAARQVASGKTPGVSVDLDEVSFRVEVAKELLDDMDPDIAEGDDGEPEIRQADENGRVTIAEIDADDELMVTTDARVRAATIVAIPAFEEARIELDSELPELDGEPVEQVEQVVAGSFPNDPPGEWFNDPALDGPTHITVTDDGRVYGHLATWGTCHTAYQGQCVTPPVSSSGYAYFRVGSLITREGAEIPVGHLTLDTLHAKKNLSAADTLAHYEHTGKAVADVAVGEDSHGIWVAGSLRSNVSDEQVRALRASPLSGDWRRIGSSLELVAALAVNVPGFPVPRPEGLVAGGTMASLVASGMLPPGKVIAPGQPGALSNDDLRYLKRLADRERREDEAAQVGIDDRAAQLARRVRAVKLARQVRRR